MNKIEDPDLKDLLAIIHRDGGQYTDEHGLAKSMGAAIGKINTMRGALDNCRYYAARERTGTAWAATITRFCIEGGSVPNVLRSAMKDFDENP